VIVIKEMHHSSTVGENRLFFVSILFGFHSSLTTFSWH